MKSESTYTMTSSIIIFLVTMIACFELGFCRDDPFIRIIKTHNCDKTFEIDSIGRFAVEQHNKQQNSLLEFAKVLNAREQVVAGKIYHLTLEAIDAGKIKIYDAKVWVKPWMNFKQLQEFKIKDGSLFTSADLGLKHESNGLEWSVVPTFDQTVKDAAVHAVKAIQNRSNSLFPYHLLEILKAKAKVIKDSTEFALLLKVRRGNTDEKFNVVVNKKIGGVFSLHQMEQDHS